MVRYISPIGYSCTIVLTIHNQAHVNVASLSMPRLHGRHFLNAAFDFNLLLCSEQGVIGFCGQTYTNERGKELAEGCRGGIYDAIQPPAAYPGILMNLNKFIRVS
jgi:hypothetical protein